MTGKLKKAIKYLSKISTKKYLYSVAIALLPLMVIYGIIEESEVSAYIAAITAILGFGAAAIVPTSTTEVNKSTQENTGDKHPQSITESFDSSYHENNDNYLT